MALFDDDPFPRPAPKAVKLEELSIHELEARMAGLEAEIGLCRDLIAAKRASATAADSVFRKPT